VSVSECSCVSSSRAAADFLAKLREDLKHFDEIEILDRLNIL